MPKPTRRDIDGWFAELGRELHAIYSERQLTPDLMRERMAEVSKQMAAYRIKLWWRD